MAGKITDYTPLTTLSDGDLSDWSNFDEVSAYDSRSVSWADLKTNIQNQITFNNIYTQNGTLTGNRIVSMGVNDLTFGSTGDSNLLKFETTNDRIGIGTATPTEKLEVVGNSYLNGFAYVQSGANFGGTSPFGNQLVVASNWIYNHGFTTIKNDGSNRTEIKNSLNGIVLKIGSVESGVLNASSENTFSLYRGSAGAGSNITTGVQLTSSWNNGGGANDIDWNIKNVVDQSSGLDKLSLIREGADVAVFDNDSTAGNTRFLIYDVDNGTLERVSVGAADSGGTGFKLLRIAN